MSGLNELVFFIGKTRKFRMTKLEFEINFVSDQGRQKEDCASLISF